MYKDIDSFTKCCPICLRVGEELINSKNRPIITSTEKDLWECDLIGRIPTNEGQNKFIFVAVNHYSKWTEAKVITNKDKRTVSNAIEDLIIKKHGSPKRIYSDNGCEFVNEDIKILCRKYNIDWVTNSPSHHNSVGAVERVNKISWDKIRKLSNFGTRSWERCVEEAVFGINISFHRALGTSPYIWTHGKIAPEILKTVPHLNKEMKINKENLIHKRQKIWDRYAKEIEKGQRTLPYNLEIGDPVLIYKNPPGNKLKAKWIQGYKIIDKSPPDGYLVSNNKSHFKLNKVHIKKDLSKS